MSRLNQSHKRSWVFFLTFFCSLKLVERIISSLQLGENLPVKFFVPIWSHLLSPSTVNSFFSNVTSPLRVAGTCWESVCAEVLFLLKFCFCSFFCLDSSIARYQHSCFLPSEPVFSGKPTLTFNFRQITQFRKTTPLYPSCFFLPLSRTSLSFIFFYLFSLYFLLEYNSYHFYSYFCAPSLEFQLYKDSIFLGSVFLADDPKCLEYCLTNSSLNKYCWMNDLLNKWC